MSNINRLMRGCFQPLRHYVPPPQYFAVQNTGEEFLMYSIVEQKYPIKLRGTAMEEFKIFEATLLNLFPCAAQRYRGSAHRARGLVLQKNPMCFFFNPSLRRCRSSVSPLYCCAIQGRRGEYSQRTEKIKRPFKATHLILSLCIATIDIGGSARRAKGLKQNQQ